MSNFVTLEADHSLDMPLRCSQCGSTLLSEFETELDDDNRPICDQCNNWLEALAF